MLPECMPLPRMMGPRAVRVASQCGTGKHSHEPSAALGFGARAHQHLARYAAHLQVVVPRQLRAALDEVAREERHLWEANVVRVHERILHEHVRATGVLGREREERERASWKDGK